MGTYSGAFYEADEGLMRKAMSAATDAQLRGHGSHGPNVQMLEHALARYWGVEPSRVVCTDSCTSAMAIAHVVLRSLVVGVPSITWNATANAAVLAGCDVKLLPCEESGMLRLTDDETVDLLVPVQLYGMRNQDFYQQRYIVDAAQGFENPVDEKAEATCYSFHTLKSLPMGVGGAVVFRYEHQAEEARYVRFHGVNERRQQWKEGWKATMPDFMAAAGLVMLEEVDRRFERRCELSKIYERYLDPQIHHHASGTDAAHAVIVRVHSRETFRRRMETLGIDTAHYYPSLVTQPYWAHQTSTELVDDVELGDELVALPLHVRMSDENARSIAEYANREAQVG